MKKQKAWINGRFIDINKAKISIFDRGFLYGDAVFESMRSYAGIVFKLDEHLARLFKGLSVLRISPPYSRKYIKSVIYNTLKANGLKSAYIRLEITRGEGRIGIGHKDNFKPNVVLTAKELKSYPEWMYEDGLSVKISEIRQNEHSPIAGVKSGNYLSYILAKLSALEKDHDDAILLDMEGRVSEASTSNVFLVKKNIIKTPSLDTGILPGVTRGVIINIAGRLRLKLIEGSITCKELLNSDEVFLTSSLAEVLPVTGIGSKKIGKGRPGEMTKLLHISYQKEVIKEVINI